MNFLSFNVKFQNVLNTISIEGHQHKQTTIFQQAYVTYKFLKFLQASHSTWSLNSK